LIDLNQHVEIGPAAEELLSKGNRKKNRQFSENMGTVVVNSLDDFEEIVSVLQKSRERHNVTLSMSRNQILNALQAMPNAYTTYAAKIGHEVIAAAITVQIDTQTVYVLYWGDDNGSWKNLSPTVAIFMRIYNESLLRGIKVLDLGTSSVNAQVNEGLRRFKNNLGAVESKRITSKFKI
jgi:lipid II:glycine glycyltransferase (peptidoglycan interpeptide bridge formation enzyme)